MMPGHRLTEEGRRNAGDVQRLKMKSYLPESKTPFGFGVLLAFCLVGGCAGPGPDLFPIAPIKVKQLSDGTTERQYDTNNDSQADYAQRLSGDGLVTVLRYDTDGDGLMELDISAPAASTGNDRHLVIILDSIPFDMVREMQQEGRFRLFHHAGRIISPFPVMTDLCLAEFFGASPCLAVEAQRYDGQHLNGGYGTYATKENSPWLACVDYYLDFKNHWMVYFWPDAWFSHELRRIQEIFRQKSDGNLIGYCVGTSALGAKLGRDGHRAALIKLDRFCQSIVHRMKGHVQITLLSDHGHNLKHSRYMPLSEIISRCGYRVTDRLEKPGDVVVPEFGVVTCASIYTRQPASVARDLIGVEGIELTVYQDERGDVIVLGRDGSACITRTDTGYRYVPQSGDPLQLKPILDALAQRGAINPDGSVEDRVLFEATVDHTYPDVVHRLWHAFNGLIAYTPDVLISIEDSYHCGRRFMSEAIDLAAAHGNLHRLSSSGFVMTTAGQLPPVVRMGDLADVLRDLDVPIPLHSESPPTGAVAVGPLSPPLRDGIVKKRRESPAID